MTSALRPTWNGFTHNTTSSDSRVNFLAHFHLAAPDEGLLVGALEGDFLKGPLHGQRDADVEAGVRLHRFIDAYTDDHAAIAALRQRFPTSLRRYAGILIDLAFDHYLTAHWPQYDIQPLSAFADGVCQTLDRRRDQLSPAAQRMLDRLIEFEILTAYGPWSAVTGSAARIGERFRRGNPLRDTDSALAPLRPELERAFLAFYPDLQQAVRSFHTH